MKNTLLNRTICVIVAIFFSINDICFGLGVQPGSTQPPVQDKMYAAGQKLWVEKYGPGAANFDELGPGYCNFTGAAPEMPNVEFVPEDTGAYNIYVENHSASKNIFKEKDLIIALRLFAFEEAKLPLSLFSVNEGYFEADENKGELPIARIEKFIDQGQIKYNLVVDTRFVQLWNYIRENDIYFTYDFSDGQRRTVSLAWGIFYRLAKHEMADLKKTPSLLFPDTGLPKGGGHIVYSPDKNKYQIRTKDAETNSIGGRYAVINDALWMWFLGSYCFGKPTQYNNDALRNRLLWFFGLYKGKGEAKFNRRAIEHGLPDEFPNLHDAAAREEAINLALAINYRFFTRPIAIPTPGSSQILIDEAMRNIENRKAAGLMEKHLYAGGTTEASGSEWNGETEKDRALRILDALIDKYEAKVQESAKAFSRYANKMVTNTVIENIECYNKLISLRTEIEKMRLDMMPETDTQWAKFLLDHLKGPEVTEAVKAFKLDTMQKVVVKARIDALEFIWNDVKDQEGGKFKAALIRYVFTHYYRSHQDKDTLEKNTNCAKEVINNIKSWLGEFKNHPYYSFFNEKGNEKQPLEETGKFIYEYWWSGLRLLTEPWDDRPVAEARLKDIIPEGGFKNPQPEELTKLLEKNPEATVLLAHCDGLRGAVRLILPNGHSYCTFPVLGSKISGTEDVTGKGGILMIETQDLLKSHRVYEGEQFKIIGAWLKVHEKRLDITEPLDSEIDYVATIWPTDSNVLVSGIDRFGKRICVEYDLRVDTGKFKDYNKAYAINKIWDEINDKYDVLQRYGVAINTIGRTGDIELDEKVQSVLDIATEMAEKIGGLEAKSKSVVDVWLGNARDSVYNETVTLCPKVGTLLKSRVFKDSMKKKMDEIKHWLFLKSLELAAKNPDIASRLNPLKAPVENGAEYFVSIGLSDGGIDTIAKEYEAAGINMLVTFPKAVHNAALHTVLNTNKLDEFCGSKEKRARTTQTIATFLKLIAIRMRSEPPVLYGKIVAYLKEGEALVNQNNRSAAEQEYLNGLALFENMHKTEQIIKAGIDLHNQLAALLWTKKSLSGAEKHYRASVELARLVPSLANSAYTAPIIMDLLDVLIDQGKTREAAGLIKESKQALLDAEKKFQEAGNALFKQERYGGALACFSKAYEISQRLFEQAVIDNELRNEVLRMFSASALGAAENRAELFNQLQKNFNKAGDDLCNTCVKIKNKIEDVPTITLAEGFIKVRDELEQSMQKIIKSLANADNKVLQPLHFGSDEIEVHFNRIVRFTALLKDLLKTSDKQLSEEIERNSIYFMAAATQLRECAVIMGPQCKFLTNGQVLAEAVTTICEYKVDIYPDKGPGAVVLSISEQEDIYKSISLLDDNQIEILIPQSIGISDMVKRAIMVANNRHRNEARKKSETEKDVISYRIYSDEKNLKDMIKIGPEKDIKRIIIINKQFKDEGAMDEYIKLLGEDIAVLQDTRLLNVLLPQGYNEMNPKDMAFHQFRIMMIAILALLVEKDNEISKITLAAMLEGYLMNGNTQEFVEALTQSEKAWISSADRIKYFLSRTVSLLPELIKEFELLKLRMKTFWVAA